jgi:UDP-N-acetylmuramate dehydrogenase
MMTAINLPPANGNLIERLPKTRGRLVADASLARFTWFGVGGPAEVLFEPVDKDDLIAFLAAKPADVTVTIIGAGSNLLIRDGGISGVTIRLGAPFANIAAEGTVLRCGGAAPNLRVSAAARDTSIGGLEFLSGIPGTLGGSVRMNAGAFGREMKDVLVAVEAIDGRGVTHVLAGSHLEMSYRHCGAPADWIFTEIVLDGEKSDSLSIARKLKEIKDAREDAQPQGVRTGGSTFKNPAGAKAWELIDRAGCRGLTKGGAQVSEKHCNFLVNLGGATATDIEELGEEVRQRVKETSGHDLTWEIRRIGIPLTKGEKP